MKKAVACQPDFWNPDRCRGKQNSSNCSILNSGGTGIVFPDENIDRGKGRGYFGSLARMSCQRWIKVSTCSRVTLTSQPTSAWVGFRFGVGF